MTQALSASERARGRRLAIASHPAGMTFYMVFTQQLPTLALVHLGASEAAVGLQTAFIFAFQLLQLPLLRVVGRLGKRRILVLGQALALLGALPLVAFPRLEGGGHAVPLALASFALAAVGLNVSQTAWFPMLRGYVEADAIGRFFGVMRSAWHLALILYYLAAQAWLAGHPGAFGPLFLLGWLCGALRIAMVARLPEQGAELRERIRLRDAWRLLREHADLRRYLAGSIAFRAVFWSVAPFALVMLEREVGFSHAAALSLSVAWYAGGLLSVYAWGRWVDRFGAYPIFRATALGMGLVILGLLVVDAPGPASHVGAAGIFLALYALASGFGVADTQVLFRLAPPEAPTRLIVVGQVLSHVGGGLPPIAVGLVLDAALAGADSRLGVYRAFFAVAALLQALAFLPLRRFR